MLKKFLRRSWAKLYTHNTCISATCSQRLLCQPPLLHTGEGMWMRNLKLPFERVWKSLCSCLLLCVCVPVHTWDCAMAQDLIQMTVNKNTALVLRPHSASRLKGCGLCGAAQISLTLRLKCLRVCMRDSWLNTPMLSTHTHIQLLVPFTHTNSRSAISELPEHGAFAINLHL